MDSRDAMLESLYSIFASITGVLLGASVLCMVQIGYIMFCCCAVCCRFFVYSLLILLCYVSNRDCVSVAWFVVSFPAIDVHCGFTCYSHVLSSQHAALIICVVVHFILCLRLT